MTLFLKHLNHLTDKYIFQTHGNLDVGIQMSKIKRMSEIVRFSKFTFIAKSLLIISPNCVTQFRVLKQYEAHYPLTQIYKYRYKYKMLE